MTESVIPSSGASVELIFHYFPNLTGRQQEQFRLLGDLYREWNTKVNVISRKDIDNLYLHHVLHSLAIAKVITFVPGTRVIDVGTGGGFPGIPLAILFPDVYFLLVDSIGKKINVVTEVAKGLGLENLEARKSRAEELHVRADFVVSRAVATFREFYGWTGKLIRPGSKNALRNGILYLKGGDLDQEIKDLGKQVVTFDISQHFKEDFFETKKVVYVPCP